MALILVIHLIARAETWQTQHIGRGSLGSWRAPQLRLNGEKGVGQILSSHCSVLCRPKIVQTQARRSDRGRGGENALAA